MAAFAKITPIEIGALNTFTEEAASATRATALATNGATSATLGAYFEMDGKDEQYLILIENTASTGADATVTIKAGNGLQGGTDLAFATLGNGEFTCVQVESGRFKNVAENETLKDLSSASAADQVPAKGKVFITGSSTDIKVTVFKTVV